MAFFRTWLKRSAPPVSLESGPLPVVTHLALIMDGNGRWGEQRGLPRSLGHRKGAQNLKRIVEACCERKIQYLTVYAFSTENWKRPAEEVDELMQLFTEFFETYDTELQANGVRMRFMGDLQALPQKVQETIAQTQRQSAQRTQLQLILAFNYGGRRELTQAAQRWAQLGCPDGESGFSKQLYLPDVPDPELIVRTGGEWRLSNFMLWQAAYAEFVVSEALWPDFDAAALDEALAVFANRQRRFGGLNP